MCVHSGSRNSRSAVHPETARWPCGCDEGAQSAPSCLSLRPPCTPLPLRPATHSRLSPTALGSPENINKFEHGYCGRAELLPLEVLCHSLHRPTRMRYAVAATEGRCCLDLNSRFSPLFTFTLLLEGEWSFTCPSYARSNFSLGFSTLLFAFLSADCCI